MSCRAASTGSADLQKGSSEDIYSGCIQRSRRRLSLAPPFPKNDEGAKMSDECSNAYIKVLAKYDEISVISATQWLSSVRFDARWQFHVRGRATPI